MDAPALRGRGAADNPPNRFQPLALHREWEEGEDPDPGTTYLRDDSRSAISRNDSPDVGFETSLNPYRGCVHGCAYCFARPTHEYFGFSAGLDFETKILVKERAPELLRSELASPRWTPQTLVLSGVTDPYQPVERRLRITRRCLEVLAEFRNPVSVITKGDLVARDADLLAELAADRAAAVTLSITTLEPELARRMEPRAATPARRLSAIERLSSAGVPVGVNVAPLIPGLNDHEMPGILAAAAEAGASFAGWILLRLPHGVAGLFDGWLERHVPERRRKVLGRIREARGGRLNDPRFGSRMKGEGEYAEHLARLFRVAGRRAGLSTSRPILSAAAFRSPASGSGAIPRRRRERPAAEGGGIASQLDIFG